MAFEYVLAAVIGQADAPLHLVEGRPFGPFSVGRDAFFRIRGPGVADVHAHLAFDGNALWVRALAGVVVGRAFATYGSWTPVPMGTTLTMGTVSVRLVRAPSRLAETRLAPIASPPPARTPDVATAVPAKSARKALFAFGAAAAVPLAILATVGVAPAAEKVAPAARAAAPAPSTSPAPSASIAAPAATASAPPPATRAVPTDANEGEAAKRAVDAMASGRYAEAADLYDRLAAHTKKPVYRVAARVARTRAGASAR